MLKQKFHPGFWGYFKRGINAEKMRETKTLSLHNVDIPNFDFLRFFPNLESLLLTSPTLNNLGGLQYTPKLTCINITSGWPNGADLRPLAYCRELEELDLCLAGKHAGTTATVIKTGLDALRKLRKLKYLGLSGMGLRDIAWIAEMEGLEEIDLSYNLLSNLTPLKALRQVNEIDLTGCGLDDIPALGADEA